MNKPILILLLAIFISVGSIINTEAQTQDNDSRITVDAIGEATVSADRIQFRINITQFSQDAREAFQIHKQQEEFLTNLLLEEDIPDSNITANPINISPVRRHNDSNTVERGYETSQQVLVVLADITQFESMQIKLIENGFVDFSGSFSSTKLAEASDKALKNAFQQARMKAEILAKAAGKEITDVITINYHSGRNYVARSSGMEMAYDAGSSSLLQFERIIPVRENVSVQFRIE